MYNYFPLEEQAINTEQFIHEEGRNQKHQRNWNRLCQMSPLFHLHVSKSQCLVLSLCQAVWRLSLLWVPGYTVTVCAAGLVTVSGWDRCLLDVRPPVTHSHSPAWACAPQVCVEGRGKEQAYTGSQPATSGPVHPKHKTWTSHNRDWCPLVFQTCSEDSETVQSWSQPHMCRGR